MVAFAVVTFKHGARERANWFITSHYAARLVSFGTVGHPFIKRFPDPARTKGVAGAGAEWFFSFLIASAWASEAPRRRISAHIAVMGFRVVLQCFVLAAWFFTFSGNTIRRRHSAWPFATFSAKRRRQGTIAIRGTKETSISS